MRTQLLWYALGAAVRIAVAAPFLQNFAEKSSQGSFSTYFVFLLLAAPMIAWAYAISFPIQLLLVDGIKPLKSTISVVLLILLLSPLASYGAVALMYPGMLLGMLGLAIAFKGPLLAIIGFAWMLIRHARDTYGWRRT